MPGQYNHPQNDTFLESSHTKVTLFCATVFMEMKKSIGIERPTTYDVSTLDAMAILIVGNKALVLLCELITIINY